MMRVPMLVGVFNDRVAGVMLITLAAGTHKLQFDVTTFDLGCAIGLEDTQVCLFAKAFGYGLSKGDATTYDNHIDVGTFAMEENIAHITANDIALQAETIGFLTHKVKDREVYFWVGG